MMFWRVRYGSFPLPRSSFDVLPRLNFFLALGNLHKPFHTHTHTHSLPTSSLEPSCDLNITLPYNSSGEVQESWLAPFGNQLTSSHWRSISTTMFPRSRHPSRSSSLASVNQIPHIS